MVFKEYRQIFLSIGDKIPWKFTWAFNTLDIKHIEDIFKGYLTVCCFLKALVLQPKPKQTKQVGLLSAKLDEGIYCVAKIKFLEADNSSKNVCY